MSLLRNLARRRLRTALAVTGITIDIWALVVTDRSGGASSRSPIENLLADPQAEGTPR